MKTNLLRTLGVSTLLAISAAGAGCAKPKAGASSFAKAFNNSRTSFDHLITDPLSIYAAVKARQAGKEFPMNSSSNVNGANQGDSLDLNGETTTSAAGPLADFLPVLRQHILSELNAAKCDAFLRHPIIQDPFAIEIRYETKEVKGLLRITAKEDEKNYHFTMHCHEDFQ